MSTDAEPVDPAHAAIIYQQLRHEDGLMVNRLSWLVASQSFLFTAYAIVLNGAPPPNPAPATRQHLLLALLPVLGLATCGLIYLGVLAGVRVTTVLRRKLWPHRDADGGAWAAILATTTPHAFGLVAPLLLPPVFFVAWAMLLWDR